MSSSFERDLVIKVAIIQAKLAVVANNSDVLSDLNDLKETKKHETDLASLISVYHNAGRIPENPLAFVESEIVLLADWGNQVQKLIDLGEDLLSSEQLIDEKQKAGLDKIRLLELKIIQFQADVLTKASELRSKIPKQCFNGNAVDPRIIEIWQLRLTAGRKINKISDLAKLVEWLGATNEKQDKVIALKNDLIAYLDVTKNILVEANAQLAELESTISRLEKGHLSAAIQFLESTAKPKFKDSSINKKRFHHTGHATWARLEAKINDFNESIKSIKLAGNSTKIIRAVNYSKLKDIWEKVEPNSELGLELNRIKKKAESDRLKFWIILGAISLIFISAIIYARKLDADMKEKAHLAQVAAAKEKADAEAKDAEERIAAATKAEEERIAAAARAEEERIAAAEKAEAERLRAENQLIAAKAKAEAERIAGAAKVEAERLRAEGVAVTKAEAERQIQIELDKLNSAIVSKRNENLNELIDGVNASNITEETRERRNLHPSLKGHLIITQVDANSPYADRLLADMIILEIDRTSVTDLKEARQLLTTGRHLLFINYRSLNRFITVTIK